jgi:hypothetical protein
VNECHRVGCGAEVLVAWSVSDTGRDDKENLITPDSVGGDAGSLAVWKDTHGLLRWRRLSRSAPTLRDGEQRARSHWDSCKGQRWSGR